MSKNIPIYLPFLIAFPYLVCGSYIWWTLPVLAHWTPLAVLVMIADFFIVVGLIVWTVISAIVLKDA